MGGRSSKVEDESKTIEHDPKFKGPAKNRGCTDVLCCILFTVFVFLFLAVGLYAFVMGDARLMIFPADSDGQFCGSGQHKTKPFLFYFDISKCFSAQSFIINPITCQSSKQICVKECPSKYWFRQTGPANEAICDNNIVPNNQAELDAYLKKDLCASYYITTHPVLYRCIPNPLEDIPEVSKFLNPAQLNDSITGSQSFMSLQGYGTRILSDLQKTWWIILLFLLLAVIISFVWLVLMRWIAGILVWITLVAVVGLMAATIGYSFHRYVKLKDLPQTGNFQFSTDAQYYNNRKETWLAIGIISSIVLGVVLIVLLVLIKKIRIAIALIKETSRAISSMMFTLLWPVVPFILNLIIIAYWAGSALLIASITRTKSCHFLNDTGTNVDEVTSVRCKMYSLMQNIDCSSAQIGTPERETCENFTKGLTDDRYTIALQAFQVFMWFWLMNFVIALSHITLAGAFASYYWAFNKPHDIPTFPVLNSLGRAVRYHLGSMAFGSLLISIVQFIMVVLEYIDHKLKGAQNLVAKFLIKCCICCLWCLEKFLKFLNKNAYIMIAIHGKNFCSSAFRAFSLILRNIVRVFVVDKLTDMLIFVNKLFVVAGVGLFAYFMFAGQIPHSDKIIPHMDLNFHLVPFLIVVVGSYVVASAFFGVYNMGVDTLFLCFLEDLERNDGSAEKPYFMSKNLMDILGKKNIQPERTPVHT